VVVNESGGLCAKEFGVLQVENEWLAVDLTISQDYSIVKHPEHGELGVWGREGCLGVVSTHVYRTLIVGEGTGVAAGQQTSFSKHSHCRPRH